jgi:tetratricopeptide (TPR) repeat protein
MLSLADALLWERQYEAAIPLYQAFLKREPMHQEALVRLGLALDGAGRAEESRELFAAIEAHFPQVPSALKALGMHSLAQRDFATAASYYERALAIDPRDLEAIARLAECEAGLGELSKATALVDRAAAQFPDDSAMQLLRAQVHLWARDYAAAGGFFNDLLARWPDDPGAVAGLGRTYAWQGDFKRALPYLEKAYGVSGDPEVGRDLANAYLGLKRGKEAAALYEKILPDLHPAPDELAGAANAFMAAGDVERAKTLAQQALAADPQSRAAQLVLTDLAIKGHHFGEAETLLRRLAAANPQDTRLREKLGDVLMWQGKFAEAQREYESVVGGRGKNGGGR